MKRILLTCVIILGVGLFATSCKESKKSKVKSNDAAIEVVETEEVIVVDSTESVKKGDMAMVEYQCPMKCEGEKTYHAPGACPVCKMDLKEVKKGD
jgi:hypothetical protein